MNNSILEFASALIKKYRSGEDLDNINAKFYQRRIDGLLYQLDEAAKEYAALQKIADDRWEKYYTVGSITIITPDIAIVDVYQKGELMGYFPIVKGRASSTYSEDKEEAILIAFGEKYDGLNSQFASYAVRMLGKVE